MIGETPTMYLSSSTGLVGHYSRRHRFEQMYNSDLRWIIAQYDRCIALKPLFMSHHYGHNLVLYKPMFQPDEGQIVPKMSAYKNVLKDDTPVISHDESMWTSFHKREVESKKERHADQHTKRREEKKRLREEKEGRG